MNNALTEQQFRSRTNTFFSQKVSFDFLHGVVKSTLKSVVNTSARIKKIINLLVYSFHSFFELSMNLQTFISL